MSSQQRAPHRICVGRRLDCEGNEAILRRPSRIVTEDRTASAAMSFERYHWTFHAWREKPLRPCEECCLEISSHAASYGRPEKWMRKGITTRKRKPNRFRSCVRTAVRRTLIPCAI